MVTIVLADTKPNPGLYLSGAGTHPTAGICGIPGQLAAKEAPRRVKAD